MSEAQRIILNDHGRHTGVDDVYCLSSMQPDVEYFVRTSLMNDDEGTVELPVRSIGRNRQNGLYYFATDERFLNAHGFECVYPEVKTVELDLALNPQTGQWTGRVLGPNRYVLYRTSKGRKNVNEIENILRAWCQHNGYELPGQTDDDDPPPTVLLSAEAA